MSEKILVTDTHPLVWYLSNKESKLPKHVFEAFKAAQEGGETYIWVPSMVAWEISELMRNTDRIKLSVPYEELIRDNFYFKNLEITELLPEDLAIGHSLNLNRDPFDRLIVATALRLGVPLMTADSEITDALPCDIFWR